jgi:hypothetical protein
MSNTPAAPRARCLCLDIETSRQDRTILRELGVDAGLNTAICFVGGFVFRMLAIRFGWKLPTFSYQQRWD